MDQADGGSPKGKRVAIPRTAALGGAAAELVMLLETVTADGTVTECEARDLQNWLDDHQVSELPAIEYLRHILSRILEDGRITREERVEIHKAIERVLPPDLRQGAKERRQALEAIEKAQRESERREKATEIALAQPSFTTTFQVAGVSHEGRSAVVERFAHVGDVAYLRREPTNRHDANAIQVLLEFGYVAGYVPREDAAMLAPYLDRGYRQKAAIKWISRGRRYSIPGISLCIYAPNTTAQGTLAQSDIPSIADPTISRPEFEEAKSTSGCGGCAMAIGGFALFIALAAATCGK